MPKATPEPVVQALHRALGATMAAPTTRTWRVGAAFWALLARRFLRPG